MPILLNNPELEVVVWPEDTSCDRDWLLENAPGATGIIVLLSDKLSDYLCILEHIDVPELAKRGVKLGYTPDVLTDAVADLSIMLALMAGRNAKETTQIVQSGQWPNHVWSPFGFCGPQLSATPTSPTRTAGFIGFGRIAKATLARLVPFGFTRCLYTANPSTPPNAAADAQVAAKYGIKEVHRVNMAELARESDVIFVLAPGGQNTYHIVNENFLKQMKKTAVLVNTSRGTLVDSDALAKALREGWLHGAGVDVVEGEPDVDANHPLVKAPRCVVLPHIASATTETRIEMATLAVNNLVNGIFGKPMPAELNTSR
ncbi:hypothetical protein BN946_scf184774.g12 [Trametes cinnabarina]|uniref:D-isomer specific 2-hydroxyacid dehydrogenase NAD-binding domain-containing protein n=1 Tax=Pycnoporus cinnabarinus TaxID=5643 RepID=A0A060SD22_PYCCI|nr:hypothetical protein BN946_scf184774.g12 [Trametes cinnabarina]